ncbi:MAG: NAD(P)H-dependent oxidoreductase subunit E [Elusimicrobium sp.]|jgi:NADH-quinone oxidoreductase subunit E|nr:NAD(P)H-dependent oxidoreductase subunit E [Elusimicrobium sp.]
MAETNTPSIDLQAIADKWKGKDGSLIMILHTIQDTLGYVPREISLELSKLINVPLARIYEVLTFYHFFKLTPPAKYQISVCHGTACYLKGAADLVKELQNITGVNEGETSHDGIYSVTALRCVGCCALAPVMLVNGKVYAAVKPADVKAILNEFMKEGAQNA